LHSDYLLMAGLRSQVTAALLDLFLEKNFILIWCENQYFWSRIHNTSFSS
jgi:hypothetical protein